MRLHVIYRLAPGDGKKAYRPPYFSKENCLKSFQVAYAQLDDSFKGDLVYLLDGELPDHFASMFKKNDCEIVQLGGKGNSASLSYAHKLALENSWSETDVIYFAEDDYLYVPEAFKELVSAFGAFESDYITLYDHPDRYTRVDDDPIRNRLDGYNENRFWRSVESTCQTFGVRKSVLKKDKWIHKLARVGNYPKGREMFRAIQGIGKYSLKYPKRSLIGPVPTLCTHMETQFLAYGVDWAKVSEEAESAWLELT